MTRHPEPRSAQAPQRVVDYSLVRPDGAAIRAAGFSGAMRYLSYDAAKNLSPDERDDLFAASLAIGLVWETTATRALSGWNGGVADAAEALRQATALGLPVSRPIYFAVDFDTTPQQQATIDAYLGGAASVLGSARVGVYGSFYVVERCHASESAHWFWQTDAWSGGQLSAHAQLYQDGGPAGLPDADNNVVLGDWGPWVPAGADPAPRSLITSGGEGTMILIPDPGEPGLHRFYVASPHGNVRWSWSPGGEGEFDAQAGEDIDLGGAGLLPGTLAVALHTYQGRYRFAVAALSGDGQVYQKVMDGPDRSVIEDWRPVPTAEPVLAPGGATVASVTDDHIASVAVAAVDAALRAGG